MDPQRKITHLARLCCRRCTHCHHFYRYPFVYLPCRRLFEVPDADDIVAVEHIAGSMTRNHHRHALGDSRTNKIPDAGPTEIVPKFTREPGSLTSGTPGFVERLHLPALVVEQERAVR